MSAPTLLELCRSLQYSEASICSILGVKDVALIHPHDRVSYLERLARENNSLALMIAFWLIHQPCRTQQIVQLLGREQVGRLVDAGLVKESNDTLIAQVDLYPCLGQLVFTDPLLNLSYGPNHVYQLGTDSYALARLTPRQTGKKALDLCTGSGIHAILSAQNYDLSIGVDVNPRALHLCKINAQMNGVGAHCQFLQGDLYEPVKGQKFDLITINPPFVPTPDTEMHLHRTGGESGEVISQRAVAGLGEFLAEGGTFSMILDYPIMRSSTYLERLCGWLGGGQGWGVALLDLGYVSVEQYVKQHVDRSDIDTFNAMYKRYLESYLNQGIYRVGFANVFIRRLPPSHPGFAREHFMSTPYTPMQPEMETWLRALARYSQSDWEPQWIPGRSSWIGDLWLNEKADTGLVEFSDTRWSGAIKISGAAMRLLRLVDGRLSAAQLAQRWAALRKIALTEARLEVKNYLAELGTYLLLI